MLNLSGQSQPDLLGSLKIAAPCNVSWESMDGDDRVRHCGQCEKNVYNISNMTKAQANEFLRATNFKACVNFYQREDGTILVDNCPIGLRRLRNQYKKVAATVGALLSLAQGFMLNVLAGEQLKDKTNRDSLPQIPVKGGLLVPSYVRGAPTPYKRGESQTLGGEPQALGGKPAYTELPSIKDYREKIKSLIANAMPKKHLGYAAITFNVDAKGCTSDVALANPSPSKNTDKLIVQKISKLKLPELPADSNQSTLSVYYECHNRNK